MTETPTGPVGICLLGGGVVGGGVLKILAAQRDLLFRRTGLRFDVRHVVVRNVKKHAAAEAGVPWTTDAAAAIDDPKVQVVLELMGGTNPAGALIERSLRLGKPVVTANKSLLADRGPELFALAHKHDTCIAFEASVGGGIPIIEALSRGLLANRIDALVGIVNGTCNVILTRMTRNGWTYPQALEEAQKLGYAEADPSLDVSGRDAAQKLALLASLAFNTRVCERDISVEGIEKLQPADITFAGSLGYVIKLLAVAERAADGQLGLRVHPTLVHHTDVLAEVSGGFNAISVFGNALGHALFYGRGAGQMPTASAAVADLISVALGIAPLSFRKLNIYPDAAPPARVLPPEQVRSRYYLRLTVKDQPGVMGQVSQILGAHKISLSAILQPETGDGQPDPVVPVVITTHQAAEGPMRQSLMAIDALQTVIAPTVCLRVIDQPKEFAGE
jgi:homoserine dehydrogenase